MNRQATVLTRLLAMITGIALAVLPLVVIAPAQADTPSTSSDAPRLSSNWTPRPEKYPGVASQSDLALPMSDGTILRGDVKLPADASGQAISGRFPVIVTITAYNKTVIGGSFGAILAGADPDYLVKRGYVQLTVDARGTGNSEGQWGAFSQRENDDAGEIIEWAHSSKRPWSNGNIGMTGASYMGISQIFAAAHKPAGLKAIFPQVPGADTYRDVVASGGQIDVGFIPLWLGLVTATGLIPPAYGANDPEGAGKSIIDHLTALGTFTAPLLVNAIAGQEPAYDGPFYKERSPINVVSKVDVPTFFIGGEYDLFQRGTPLLFENLAKRGVPTKFIWGPWDHLQGSSGADVVKAGYGTLSELQLRWFDKYVKGATDKTLDSDIPPMTYYEIGSKKWRNASGWVTDDEVASTWKLSGSSSTLGTPAQLVTGKVQDGTSLALPVPVSGLCTRSSNQWTAGIINASGLDNPCAKDAKLNDFSGPVWETPPLTSPVSVRGPINAHINVSSPTGDGMLSVGVSSVAPDGTVDRLTTGWQVISFRELDKAKTRRLDGKIIQPYHPFTKSSQESAKPGATVPVDVEIFPTGAKIPAGNKLRVSIQTFDVPHLLPPLTDLLGALSPLTIHSSDADPSTITMPTLSKRPVDMNASSSQPKDKTVTQIQGLLQNLRGPLGAKDK